MGVTPPDAIYPVRVGAGEALRYSLRTLGNVPHGQVALAGFSPSWANCRHLARTRSQVDFIDASENVLLAMRDDTLTESVIWMMDDVFILRPLKEIPTLHRGSLEKVIRGYGNKRSRYLVNMQRTLELLQSLGIQKPLCYELHIPMVVNRHAYLDLLNILPAQAGLHEFSKRTLYGNINDIRGVQVSKDVKYRHREARLPNGNFASTSNTAWQGRLGTAIRRSYPNPSPWEKP